VPCIYHDEISQKEHKSVSLLDDFNEGTKQDLQDLNLFLSSSPPLYNVDYKLQSEEPLESTCIQMCTLRVNVILLVLDHTSIVIAIAALRSTHASMDGQPNVIYNMKED
jgi:hypothetical protein